MKTQTCVKKVTARKTMRLISLVAILLMLISTEATFAVTGSQVAKDGTYTGSCGKDGATASVTVSGGKITNISVSGSDSRWSSLVSQVKGYYTGKSADYNTVDAISGATTAKSGKYSKYVKTGVLAAIKSAPAAETSSGGTGSGSGGTSGGTTVVYEYQKYNASSSITGPALQNIINETTLYYKNGDEYIKVNCYVMSNYAYYFYLDGSSYSSYFAMGYGYGTLDIRDTNTWNNLYKVVAKEVEISDDQPDNYYTYSTFGVYNGYDIDSYEGLYHYIADSNGDHKVYVYSTDEAGGPYFRLDAMIDSTYGYIFYDYGTDKTDRNNWWFSEKGSGAWTFDQISPSLCVGNVCMLTYDVQGHGQIIDSVLINQDAVPTKPTDPHDDNYTFGGWYLDDDCTEEYKFDKGITDDATLYAKWTRNDNFYGDDAITYSANFDVEGSGHVYNAVMNIIVKAGQVIAIETTGDGDWSSLIAKAITNYENKTVEDAKTQAANDVDAVSGASVYSKAFYGGIRDALAKAVSNGDDNTGDDNGGNNTEEESVDDGSKSGGNNGSADNGTVNSNSNANGNSNNSSNSSKSSESTANAKSTADKKAEASIVKSLGVDAKTAAKINTMAKKLGVSLDTLKITGKTITSKKSDGDLKGSKFGRLKPMTKKQTKNSVTLKWNKVSAADGYLIYGNRCNSKGKVYKCKLLKNVTKNGITTWTHKKLKKGTYYKYQVIAYKKVNGKRVTIDSGPMIHAVTKGGKYCVAKSIKITKVGTKKNATKITLKKGKTAAIKASEVKEFKKLKLSKHRKLCYESSNTKVATVTKAGKIKAVGKGKCSVWIYAQNGKYKTITVTVK